MTTQRFPAIIRFIVVALMSGAFGPVLLAQGPLPDAPAVSSVVEPVSPVVGRRLNVAENHKFWDRGNSALFIAAGALNAADFAVTRSNLRNGGRELNPVVRMFGSSTPGLAMNFAGETAGVISLSYFFHKTGHHKMERAVSFVDIGGSGAAVAYGLAHR